MCLSHKEQNIRVSGYSTKRVGFMVLSDKTILQMLKDHSLKITPIEKEQMAEKARFTIDSRFNISNNIKSLFMLYLEVLDEKII